ncbi:MAG: SLBB domain-containing protein, partial [Opitutaceae bacterium]|nr:SLBB domain-containing protein [Opitutaceae bacterium]
MKFLITLSLCLGSLLGTPAFAQTLSAEQQAKLNALPPSLRAQAMAEFEKFKASQGSINVQPVERPEVVKPNTAPSNEEIEAEFEMATDIVTTAEVPVAKKIKKDLKQFGYDLFAGTPTTFAPATEIPVPADYIIGPGDQIRIQFFGKNAASYDLYVTRDGLLQIPELGPISVAGQHFTELKSEIARRVSEQMIGIKAFVSLGELRSIRVFILGDVNRPGSYTVSALSTMTNALFVSGGITPIGSLRNIQLKRAGDVISEFDLYDLLLRGDTSKDVRIQPGDVIFVPPVGSLVGISGEVKRPAIYELKGGSTAMQSIDIAGGFTAKAFPSLSQIERITRDGIKEVL